MRVLPPEAFEGDVKPEEMTTAHLYLSRWAKKHLRPNKAAMHENFSDILALCETEQDVDTLLLETAQLKGVSSGTRRKWRRWAESKRQTLRTTRIIVGTAG